MTKNYNPVEYITNKEQEFTNEMVNDTLKYQKQYGFKIGKNNVAHNNESDAFRHTFMQSILSQRYTSPLAKIVSNLHEIKGKFRGQDPRKANMDLWNNHQGQQIYNEICKEYPNFKSLPETQQKDIIAQKVVQKMRTGQLITGLDDQIKAFNGAMPTNGDWHREAFSCDGVIYVNSYTRSDRTEVKGYYRSR